MENFENNTLPTETEAAKAPSTATKPEGADENSATLRIKYNKEFHDIPYSEAVTLAQKGLKFDAILPELERLKSIAARKGISIPEYITELELGAISESLGGAEDDESRALKERIFELEGKLLPRQNALYELTREFPEIKDEADLPEQVRQNAELLGGNLLSAYLLYKHHEQKNILEEKARQTKARNEAVGPQSGAAPKDNPEDSFVRGLWN